MINRIRSVDTTEEWLLNCSHGEFVKLLLELGLFQGNGNLKRAEVFNA